MDNKKEINELLNEIKKQHNIKNDRELSVFLKISQGVLGNWRLRGIKTISVISRLKQYCDGPPIPQETGHLPGDLDQVEPTHGNGLSPLKTLPMRSKSEVEELRAKLEEARQQIIEAEKIIAGKDGELRAMREICQEMFKK